jgi:hypothetical protein
MLVTWLGMCRSYIPYKKHIPSHVRSACYMAWNVFFVWYIWSRPMNDDGLGWDVNRDVEQGQLMYMT